MNSHSIPCLFLRYSNYSPIPPVHRLLIRGFCYYTLIPSTPVIGIQRF
ncbi:hypothetical protein Gotur_017443 [Gossypium turneri]